MPEEKTEELTRIYTIPLGRVTNSPRHRRAERAITIIREFAKKHMKSEDIKISEDLNLMVWKRGLRNPPKRITVKMERDEDGLVTISPFTEEVSAEAKAEEEVAEETAAETESSDIRDQSEPVTV